MTAIELRPGGNPISPLDPDMPASELRLHMGEMTAQEMRTARAAIRWANARAAGVEIAPVAPPIPTEVDIIIAVKALRERRVRVHDLSGVGWNDDHDAHRAADYLEALWANAVQNFQSRVHPWMLACFGAEVSADRLERGDRLLEEVLELLQSGDYPKERAHALVEYTFGRDKGDGDQEAGGVMVTLAAYCLAHGIDMHKAGETELARVWTKIDVIRAKQAAKPKGSALPLGRK